MTPVQYETFETWKEALAFIDAIDGPSIVIPDDDIIVMYGASMLTMAKEFYDNMVDLNQTMWDATGGLDD